MTWSSLHSDSETFAAAAHDALAHGDLVRAKAHFAQAAEAESRALESIGPDKPRTLGITAVSAAALWYKAGELKAAEQVAHRAAALPAMPPFALKELRELLQAIWNEQAQAEAGVSFASGQIIVSVKGGSVVTGGAPLDLILEKVQIVQSIFYRTAEFMKSMPLRRRGPPSKELQERCRPWLFQSVPGSYQFAVAIQKPLQGDMFPVTDEPEPEALTETFLSILRAAGDDPAVGLQAVVPDNEYRQTFLKMTRNLAPTGNLFNQLEIRGPADRKPIVLSSSSRKQISETLRPPPKVGETKEIEETVLTGVLRALDLDKDWLEVTVDGEHQRVTGVGDAIDDVIGPMVNHEVRVRVRRGKGKALVFLDIEQEE